jgi:hypothetical protein
LTSPSVDHEGRIRPCCGVLPHRDGLPVGTIGGARIEAGVRIGLHQLSPPAH